MPDAEAIAPPPPLVLHKERHAAWLAALAQRLPSKHESLDSNRMTILYFCVAGLSVLRACSLLDAQQFRAWIYRQQVPAEQGGGFRSGPVLPAERAASEGGCSAVWHDGHVTMTQCALLALLMLGDDLSGVRREGAARHLRSLQRSEDGAFHCVVYGSEADTRFVYSACVVAEVLGLWEAFDVEAAADFLVRCQRFDGGFGERPGAEGHGGTTYCAVAALCLMRRVDRIDQRRCVSWLLQRYAADSGINGRPNKDADSCYSYWVGNTLRLLGALPRVDTTAAQRFSLRCQGKRGGIAKEPLAAADPLHTSLPLMALAAMGVEGLAPLDSALGCTLQCVSELHAARQPALAAQLLYKQ
eukprot:TRINITY_DN37206_c0_g1_i4.p2 TRINITY_DN37206_c0_g1~~TRINITY_DN37206_c0_g1_i4.p2  ORF type:complete len:357 (+),score=115.11 TRINITY_DN37206_c0_g1_i4:80-1150(+)